MGPCRSRLLVVFAKSAEKQNNTQRAGKIDQSGDTTIHGPHCGEKRYNINQHNEIPKRAGIIKWNAPINV